MGYVSLQIDAFHWTRSALAAVRAVRVEVQVTAGVRRGRGVGLV